MKKYIIYEQTLNEIKEIFQHFISEGFLEENDAEWLDELQELKEVE